MKIEIATLFPEMFGCLDIGILGRARRNGLLQIGVHDIRAHSTDKHRKCDDYPFGGGAGMVMTPQPLHDCIRAIDPEHRYLRVYMSPRGKRLDQATVERLSECDGLLLVCGSYEGIDERVIQLDIDEELSIGDYVLTSGDLAAMVVVNAVARYVDGVLGSEQATAEESFADGLLEYPQYTRPQEFCGLTVPPVLLSGNHEEVRKWRAEQQLRITRERRPDLLDDKGE